MSKIEATEYVWFSIESVLIVNQISIENNLTIES